MNDDHQQNETEAGPDVVDASPTEQVSLVLDDVRALVKAELNYFRSRLDYSRHVMKWSFRFGAISAFAFSGAAIALVMGLVMTLSPHLGPLGATLVVTLGFIAIGTIFGVQARKWVRRVYFPEIEGNDDNIAQGTGRDRT